MEVRYIEIKTSPAGQIIRAYTPEQYKKEMARRENATARARKLTRLQERVGAALAMLGLPNCAAHMITTRRMCASPMASMISRWYGALSVCHRPGSALLSALNIR